MTSGRIQFASAFAALLSLAVGLAATTASAQQTVGLFTNETPQEGLTLFNPAAANTSYLINNDGLLINSWTSSFRPGAMGYLHGNGSLLRSARLTLVDARWLNLPAAGGRVESFDWDGNLTWEFEYASPDHLTHHDMEPLPNGNVLLVAWEVVTESAAIAEGKDPSLVSGELWIDHVIEVQPILPVGGTIVWEWHARDHLIQDFDVTKENFGPVEDHPELIDFNFSGSSVDWLHVNGIDYNAEFDQIVLSPRSFDEIWIIDHSTTTTEAAGHTGGSYGKGGDLLYRWGNPLAYRRGTVADQQLFGQHDPNWIAAGRPGAGNLLAFSNGVNRPTGAYSTVEEFAPPVDGNGFYPTLGPGEPFGPAAPVWTYVADPPTDFYQSGRSGAQRQANGNTLICAASRGRGFEIEADGTEIWKYVNPIGANGVTTQGENPQNAGVFKLVRYPLDDPLFVGLDLTPGDPVEIFSPPLPVPGGSLSATRVTMDGATIEVEWDVFPCPSWDYNLIYGELQDVSSYAIAGAECGLGLTGSHLWSAVPPSDLYFLIVGSNDFGLYESSWGRDSAGAERFGTKASFQCGTTTKVVSSTCP